MIIRQVRAAFFHVDGWTDRYDKDKSHFSQYSKHKKKIFWNSRAKVISLQATCLKKRRKETIEMKIKFTPNAFSTTHTKKEYHYEIHNK
jgi:hypothetical protein